MQVLTYVADFTMMRDCKSITLTYTRSITTYESN